MATKKKYIDKLSYNQIPYIEYGTKEELGSLLNKNEISLFAITDVNIAKQIKKLVKEDGKKYDTVITIGPMIMMKFVALTTKELGIPTIASLNSLMVDGTGMCGACRVSVGGKTLFTCVDGPEFDAHQVDFDEAMRRQAMFRDQEHAANEKGHKCNCF